ncbi:nodulin homeobox isoform X1 [Iris pallida]|uniref:Nodulin homeobox isoform X1 n=1 Tax=Iris pallida TaxID=29817 RepID=A0AAX6GF01_IRIPA|nr:nodulin homeobox isoform X1 [Iris pallida]
MDLFSIVEEVSGLASKEISKLLKDSENFTILCTTGKGSLRQVDVERLASSLPLHLIAVLLSPDTEMRLAHLLHGVRLLHTLADTASRHTRLEQILLDDVKFSEQLIDLVFFTLIVLARTEQDYGLGTSLSAIHLALVACTLHLLTGYISSQWQELVHVLLAHPKVDIFIDVAFDAVHADIRLLQSKLSALSNDILSKSSSLPAAERTASYLCQQCEASLQFLLSLCQQKMFRDRLLKNKELCKNGSILSLTRTILKLKVSDSFKDSLGVVASLSRLKAKVLSILLQLCEAESISYLDEVAGSSKSMHLAKAVVLEILDLLKAAFRIDAKQVGYSLEQSNPKGFALLNSLRLADIYSDDSNFRYFFMNNAIQVLIELLAIPHEEFQSSWCSPDLSTSEEDANLEYDPFTAAGVALISASPDYENALSASVPSNETSISCNSNSNGMLSVNYAQQRTSYLVKIIANLHCFVPNICGEEERDLFLNKFHERLRMDTPESFRYSSNSEGQKIAKICENLSSLSDHAASLTPSLLNDEDVNLLRGFTEQIKKLIPPQIGDNINSEPFVKDAEGIRKVEDPSPMHQSPLDWDNFSNPNYNTARKDTQYTCGVAASMLGILEASTQKRDPRFKDDDIKSGGKPESSMCSELDQRTSTSNPADFSNEFEVDENISKKKMFVLTSRMVAEHLRSIEKENRNLETKGLERNSAKGDLDLISDIGEFHRTAEHAKESGFQDYEKAESAQGEEKQPRKRKRNIMSEKQINLIEKVLVDEPEMQRNSALLQTWADKLSAQGSEITPSQLKNWLNNRKAKLARAAREVRAPSEGENTYPDKSSAPSTSQLYDSPDSAGEDPYISSTRTSSSLGTQLVLRSIKPSGGGEEHDVIPRPDSSDLSSQGGVQLSRPSRAVDLKPGQLVTVVDGEGHEVGRGKVFQVEGRWQGKNLEDVGVCIVDITEIKVDSRKEVQYPSEGGGRTFEEAAARNGGITRVAWDAVRICQLPK